MIKRNIEGASSPQTDKKRDSRHLTLRLFENSMDWGKAVEKCDESPPLKEDEVEKNSTNQKRSSRQTSRKKTSFSPKRTRSQSRPEPQLFYCKKCNENYNSYSDWKSHIVNVHVFSPSTVPRVEMNYVDLAQIRQLASTDSAAILTPERLKLRFCKEKGSYIVKGPYEKEENFEKVEIERENGKISKSETVVVLGSASSENEKKLAECAEDSHMVIIQNDILHIGDEADEEQVSKVTALTNSANNSSTQNQKEKEMVCSAVEDNDKCIVRMISKEVSILPHSPEEEPTEDEEQIKAPPIVQIEKIGKNSTSQKSPVISSAKTSINLASNLTITLPSGLEIDQIMGEPTAKEAPTSETTRVNSPNIVEILPESNGVEAQSIPDEDFRCKVCKELFMSDDELEDHFKSQHFHGVRLDILEPESPYPATPAAANSSEIENEILANESESLFSLMPPPLTPAPGFYTQPRGPITVQNEGRANYTNGHNNNILQQQLSHRMQASEINLQNQMLRQRMANFGQANQQLSSQQQEQFMRQNYAYSQQHQQQQQQRVIQNSNPQNSYQQSMAQATPTQQFNHIQNLTNLTMQHPTTYSNSPRAQNNAQNANNMPRIVGVTSMAQNGPHVRNMGQNMNNVSYSMGHNGPNIQQQHQQGQIRANFTNGPQNTQMSINPRQQIFQQIRRQQEFQNLQMQQSAQNRLQREHQEQLERIQRQQQEAAALRAQRANLEGVAQQQHQIQMQLQQESIQQQQLQQQQQQRRISPSSHSNEGPNIQKQARLEGQAHVVQTNNRAQVSYGQASQLQQALQDTSSNGTVRIGTNVTMSMLNSQSVDEPSLAQRLIGQTRISPASPPQPSPPPSQYSPSLTSHSSAVASALAVRGVTITSASPPASDSQPPLPISPHIVQSGASISHTTQSGSSMSPTSQLETSIVLESQSGARVGSGTQLGVSTGGISQSGASSSLGSQLGARSGSGSQSVVGSIGVNQSGVSPNSGHQFTAPLNPSPRIVSTVSLSTSGNRGVERPDRPPTVDLTNDESAISEPERIIRGTTGRPSVTCTLCGVLFSSLSALQDHKIHRHGQRPSQPPIGPTKSLTTHNIQSGARNTSPRPPSLNQSQQSSIRNLFIPLVDMRKLDSVKLRKLEELGVVSMIPLHGNEKSLGIPIMMTSSIRTSEELPWDQAQPIGPAYSPSALHQVNVHRNNSI